MLKPRFLEDLRSRPHCVSGEEVDYLLDAYIDVRDLLAYLMDVRDGERGEDPELELKCLEAVEGTSRQSSER